MLLKNKRFTFLCNTNFKKKKKKWYHPIVYFKRKSVFCICLRLPKKKNKKKKEKESNLRFIIIYQQKNKQKELFLLYGSIIFVNEHVTLNLERKMSKTNKKALCK